VGIGGRYDVHISEIDLDIPETLRPSTLRRLGVKPALDAKIDQAPKLGLTHRAFLPVTMLRLYRRVRPDFIGNRCVFEPSCSRYSELAFRTKPFFTALHLTLRRLHKCKPDQGGTDLSDLEFPE